MGKGRGGALQSLGLIESRNNSKQIIEQFPTHLKCLLSNTLPPPLLMKKVKNVKLKIVAM